jgi:hypothetical protein
MFLRLFTLSTAYFYIIQTYTQKMLAFTDFTKYRKREHQRR